MEQLQPKKSVNDGQKGGKGEILPPYVPNVPPLKLSCWEHPIKICLYPFTRFLLGGHEIFFSKIVFENKLSVIVATVRSVLSWKTHALVGDF